MRIIKIMLNHVLARMAPYGFKRRSTRLADLSAVLPGICAVLIAVRYAVFLTQELGTISFRRQQRVCALWSNLLRFGAILVVNEQADRGAAGTAA